jgi:hypothetical protein
LIAAGAVGVVEVDFVDLWADGLIAEVGPALSDYLLTKKWGE